MTKEALKLALEALEACTTWNLTREQFDRNVTAITAIKEALAQPEQEQRTWVGLTVEEIEVIGKLYEEKDRSIQAWGLFACAIEDKLKEKNCG